MVANLCLHFFRTLLSPITELNAEREGRLPHRNQNHQEATGRRGALSRARRFTDPVLPKAEGGEGRVSCLLRLTGRPVPAHIAHLTAPPPCLPSRPTLTPGGCADTADPGPGRARSGLDHPLPTQRPPAPAGGPPRITPAPHSPPAPAQPPPPPPPPHTCSGPSTAIFPL